MHISRLSRRAAIWRQRFRAFRLKKTLLFCAALALLIAGREPLCAEDPPTDGAHDTYVETKTPAEAPVASDLTVQGMVTYGKWSKAAR